MPTATALTGPASVGLPPPPSHVHVNASLKQQTSPFLVEISVFDTSDNRLLSRFSGFLYKKGSPNILTSSYPFHALLHHSVRYRVRYHDGEECDGEKLLKSVAMELVVLSGSRVARSDFVTAGLHQDARIFAFGCAASDARDASDAAKLSEREKSVSSGPKRGRISGGQDSSSKDSMDSMEEDIGEGSPGVRAAPGPIEVAVGVGEVRLTGTGYHLLWVFSGPSSTGGPVVDANGHLLGLVYGAPEVSGPGGGAESEGLVKAVSADSVHAVLKFHGLDELV